MTDRAGDRSGRFSRVRRAKTDVQQGLTPDLDETEAIEQEAHFGVTRDQVEHDFVISHILNKLSKHPEKFVFFGGTALSRTFLNGLRLSEDIDLLSIGPRREVAELLHLAILELERDFGEIDARPALHEAHPDTTECTYGLGGAQVKM